MTVSRRMLLRMWISNVRLFCRYKGFDGLWLFMILFFIPYLSYQKYDTESINLITLPPILLLVFLEPLITHVVRGMFDMLPRYIVGGTYLAYVIIANNLMTLAVSSLGIVAMMLGIWVGTDRFWQYSRFLLSYFGITIFPLIILGNYVSVFRHFLGLRSDGTILRRLCLYTVLIVVASIPYLITHYVLESFSLYFIIIFLSIVVWHITIMRYVSVLAHRYLFNLLESK